MASALLPSDLIVKFPDRLLALRKAKGYTQQSLADASGIHVQQIKRYETRTAQPSVDALIKLAKTLGVSTDELLFAPEDRGPSDELRLHFEAAGQLEPGEQQVILEVIEGLLLKHQAKRWGAKRQIGVAEPAAEKRARARAAGWRIRP